MEASSYSLSDAAAALGVSVPTVRALVARGQLASFRTPGGHLRIPSESIAAYRDGRPIRTNTTNTTSTALQGRRDNLEGLRLETEELRVRRDLRKLQEEEQEGENRRKAEAQAIALGRKEERERRRAETMREADARRHKAAEAEAQHRRQQWETSWLDYALKLLPSDTPHSFELDVHQAVAALLSTLEAQQPEQLIQRLIQAAIDKALQPWNRRKEIEKIIEQARNQLPVHARSWNRTPSEWDARAMRAAADAIAKLGDDAPLGEIRAVAAEEGNKIRVEYEAWKAGEDHRQTCELMVRCVFEGDDAREAVRQALEKLPVGTAPAKMGSARDAALAPFRAATKAAADADRYLQHVSDYIEKLGNEETGEWDLGSWSERYHAAKLRAKLRPLLIQKLYKETLDVDEVHGFIEEWLDRELELED